MARTTAQHLPDEMVKAIDNFRRDLTNTRGNIPSRSEIQRNLMLVGLRHIKEVRGLIEDG